MVSRLRKFQGKRRYSLFTIHIWKSKNITTIIGKQNIPTRQVAKTSLHHVNNKTRSLLGNTKFYNMRGLINRILRYGYEAG